MSAIPGVDVVASDAPATAAEVAHCLDDACAVCAIAAPTGEESDRGEWIASRLAASGTQPERDAVGNIVVRFGGRGTPLVVAAHMDTVFTDLRTIRVTREPGVLRGPGIGDNSLGVAGLLFLARRAASLAWRNRQPLALAATVGEEGAGNLRGAKELMRRLRPRAFIAIEGGFQDELIIRGAGSGRFALTVHAAGGHSWSDRGQPSAVHVLIGVLATLLERSPTETVNVGTISGGSGINALAAEAAASIEFRDLSSRRLALAEQLLHRVASKAQRDARDAAHESNVAVTIDTIGLRPAGRLAKSHELVRAALRARADAGLDTTSLTTAATDANAALAQGIPAVTLGLARNHGAHSLDEYVDVTTLGRGLTAAWLLVEWATRRLAAIGT